MILHDYWRSGAAYRTRIALNLKGLAYDQVSHDLRQAAHKDPLYLALNPQGLVPTLEDRGAVLTQSPAILEYLEEAYPEPPLLPADAISRAQVRAMAAVVGCDIHPLNNLRVLSSLRVDLGQDPASVQAWIARWVVAGFEALEALVLQQGAGWCHADQPTLADCYLVPQIYSARRFDVPLEAFPRLLAIDARAAEHPAFINAHPDRQPDAD